MLTKHHTQLKVKENFIQIWGCLTPFLKYALFESWVCWFNVETFPLESIRKKNIWIVTEVFSLLFLSKNIYQMYLTKICKSSAQNCVFQ